MAFERLSKVVADPDVAIDLGTANTRMYVLGRGIVLDKTTVAPSGGRAAGFNTHLPSHPDVAVLSGGVISDPRAIEQLLKGLMRRVRRLGLLKSRVLACAPSDASLDERAALEQSLLRSALHWSGSCPSRSRRRSARDWTYPCPMHSCSSTLAKA